MSTTNTLADTPQLQPRNPEFRKAVRSAFEGQLFSGYLGADLTVIEPGLVEIVLPSRPQLTQNFGYLHGGAIAALIDLCGGFAGWSLLPAGMGMLTVEYKCNYLAPAVGDHLIGRGAVIRSGRTLTFSEIQVFSRQDKQPERLCATGQQTLMAVKLPSQTDG